MTPPVWQDIYNDLKMKYGVTSNTFRITDKEFTKQCEQWLETKTDAEVIRFTSDLVQTCGEFKKLNGIMMPDCTDREFVYKVLATRVYEIGQHREFQKTYANKPGYGLLNENDLYAGHVEYHPEQNKWFWELIHKDRVINSGYEDGERWAWEACLGAYHILTEDHDVSSDAELEY